MIMSKTFDVCIIGGGASGLAAAVYIKQRNTEITVALLERLSRVGKKLITTGNGRCNITNKDEAISHYHGENVRFAEYALSRYDNRKIEEFFLSLGVPFVYDEVGRTYPASLQASAVVDALRFSCDELGVETFTECKATDFYKDGECFAVKTEKGDFSARHLIFAAGLYSGGIKLGCDGGILKLLESKGEKRIKVTPAIVQIKTDSNVSRSLKGIKVIAAATLIIDGKAVRRETGEVLFCDYGLSGPPILQIARETERRNGKKEVALDLMCDRDFDGVVSLLSNLKTSLSYRKLDEFLSGALNKRVGQAVIKAAGYRLSSVVSELQRGDIEKIARQIKNFVFTAVSTTGFDNSQVTAGGLDTAGFDSETMMSKTEKGVYAIGEILDIDGDCGGYNLHFAFSSAFCAADSILKVYKNDKT